MATSDDTIRIKDRGRGFASLKVRDGKVVGAMGSEPKRFLGMSVANAKALGAGRVRGGAATATGGSGSGS